MKTQENFLEIFSKDIFQENFSKLKKIFQRQENQKDFLVPYVEGAVKNFNMAVNSIGEKTKEVEQDIRKRWCDYPSS